MAGKIKSGFRHKNGKRKQPTTRADRKAQAWDYGNERVQDLRALFRGVRRGDPTAEHPEGRVIDVSDDIADAPGMLHALGYFDGHGHDPGLIRDTMRDYAILYWNRNRDKAPTLGKYERTDRAKDPLKVTKADTTYDDMQDVLRTLKGERDALEALVCDCYWSDLLPPFVIALVNEGFVAKKRIPPSTEMPTLHDKELLGDALRATFALIDNGLPSFIKRWAA